MKTWLLKINFSYYYLKWCKTYRWVQRRLPGYKKKVIDVKSRIKLTPGGSIKEHWKSIVDEFNLKWRKDKIYMLGDVISDPYISAYTNGGDCDDHGAIALEILNDSYVEHNVIYRKKGFLSIIDSNLLGGHTIAFWASSSCNSLRVISNGKVRVFSSKEDLVKWWNKTKNTKSKARFLVEYTKDLKLVSIKEYSI